MINFKKHIKPIMIKNDNGDLVDIHTISNKSIASVQAMDYLINACSSYISSGLFLRVLSDQMLLYALVKEHNVLMLDWAQNHETCTYWDATYNKAIAYYLDSLYERYQSLFKDNDTSTEYSYKNEFRLYRAKRQEGAAIAIDDIEYTDLDDIKNVAATITSESKVRSNNAGSIAMVPYCTQEKFINTLDFFTKNMTYTSNPDSLILAGILVEFIKRF